MKTLGFGRGGHHDHDAHVAAEDRGEGSRPAGVASGDDGRQRWPGSIGDQPAETGELIFPSRLRDRFEVEKLDAFRKVGWGGPIEDDTERGQVVMGCPFQARKHRRPEDGMVARDRLDRLQPLSFLVRADLHDVTPDPASGERNPDNGPDFDPVVEVVRDRVPKAAVNREGGDPGDNPGGAAQRFAADLIASTRLRRSQVNSGLPKCP